MYPVSANFHTLAIADSPKTRCRIYFISDAVNCWDDNDVQTNGTLLVGAVGDTDSNGRIGQDGVTVTEIFNKDKNITLGGTVSYQIGMTLVNSDGALNNFAFGRCKVYLDVYDNANSTWLPCPIGVFRIELPVKRKVQLISCAGYDQMQVLNAIADTWWNGLNFTGGLTIENILNSMVTQLGLHLSATSSTSMVNKTLSFTTPPIDSVERTYRDILGWIAEATGTVAHFNRDGELDMRQYLTPQIGGNNIVIDTDTTGNQCLSIDVAEYSVSQIDALTIKLTTADQGVTVGSGTNVYTIMDNPFLYGPDVATIQGKLTPIYNRLSAYATYSPISTRLIYDWSIEAGDIIYIRNNSTTYIMPIFQQKMVWRGGYVTAELISSGDTVRPQVSSGERETYRYNVEMATKVGDNEIISKINQTAEQIQIQASKVNLTGYITATNLATAGQTVINGGNITTGTISADRIAAGSLSISKLDSATQNTITTAASDASTALANAATAQNTAESAIANIGVNLSPYFNNSLDDVYNASNNPTGYWAITPSFAYISILDDGWAQVVCDNTNGATVIWPIYYNVANTNLSDDKYTMLIELKDVTVSGVVYMWDANSYDAYVPQYISNGLTVTGDGSSYITLRKTNNLNPNCFTRSGFGVDPGANVNCKVRISIYKDGYKGAYIPYVSSAYNSSVYREQTIYISKASAIPPVTANTTWVTDATGNQNTWTTVRPVYDSSYPVLFVATQTQTMANKGGTACSCTTPAIDQTTTVIDGGHITTGTIDASVVSVTNLNASNITSGTMSANKISGGTLSLGGQNNTNGQLYIYDANGVLCGKIDNTGIEEYGDVGGYTQKLSIGAGYLTLSYAGFVLGVLNAGSSGGTHGGTLSLLGSSGYTRAYLSAVSGALYLNDARGKSGIELNGASGIAWIRGLGANAGRGSLSIYGSQQTGYDENGMPIYVDSAGHRYQYFVDSSGHIATDLGRDTTRSFLTLNSPDGSSDIYLDTLPANGSRFNSPTTFNAAVTMNSTIDVTPRRCYATLSSAGWYRVMTFTLPNAADIVGAGGIQIDLIINRSYGQTNNETHRITLEIAYNNIGFVNEYSRSNYFGITKIRYNVNTTGTYSYGYVDIYYDLSVSNPVFVDFNVYAESFIKAAITAGTLQGVARSPANETRLAEYGFIGTSGQRNTFTPAYGTAAFGGCWYSRNGEYVTVHVGLTGIIANTNHVIGTLPVGYRPVSQCCASGSSETYEQLAHLYVRENGDIDIWSPNTMASLDATFMWR